MRRSLVPVALVFFLLTILGPHTPVLGKDTWVSVRSKNFLLVGNASEKEIKQVATRLEQFREVFIHLFPRMNFTSPVPTTVVVFNSDRSYRPFKPNATTAGYFQPGPDVNYITLTTEAHGEQDPFGIIFHEYTHLFVNNNMGNPPTWFNEGLAEYYRTFTITDDQKVELGRPIANHVLLLRQNKLVPLRTLFQVDSKSPYYNETNKQSIFYAQSWALMHYLIIGKEGRLAQLSDFLDKLKANIPMEQAFQQSFQMDFEAMEKELRRYIQQDRYNVMHGRFEQKIQLDTSMQTAPVSEAEAQAYLGDLLLHSNRKDCEAYLQRALALDPNLAMAHASLGMARFREGKTEEARKSLELAVRANSQNYLTHYYYAYSLSRTSPDDPQMITGYTPETAAKIRGELQKAISLRPDYPESYNLLAFVSLVTGTEMEAAITALKRALQASPGRKDFYYMLAQLYVRTSDYKTARQLLEQVANSNAEESTRQHAQTLLKQIDQVEEQKSRFEAVRKARGNGSPSSTNSQTDNSETVTVVPNGQDPSSYLREVLRQPAAGETQLQGTLVRIDCEPKGAIVFVVNTAAGVLKLKTDGFGYVEITTYSPDIKGDITCGPRNPENSVVICYVPGVDKRTKTDGVLKSIEFVPKDFKLKS